MKQLKLAGLKDCSTLWHGPSCLCGALASALSVLYKCTCVMMPDSIGRPEYSKSLRGYQWWNTEHQSLLTFRNDYRFNSPLLPHKLPKSKKKRHRTHTHTQSLSKSKYCYCKTKMKSIDCFINSNILFIDLIFLWQRSDLRILSAPAWLSRRSTAGLLKHPFTHSVAHRSRLNLRPV